ncbi:MAG: ankyrin repeat domain-containing protein [Alphaproteobacteria bacterium]
MLKNQKELNDELLIASSQNPKEQIELLLKQGAEINCYDKYGRSPIYIASQKGRVEVIEILAKPGVDLNKTYDDSRTVLMIAAYEGHAEVIKLLHKLGAEINKARIDGETALMQAALNGHVEAINALRELGAEIDKTRYDGETALMQAALNGHVEAIKTLCGLGANVNIANKDGLTALMIAARKGHVDAIQALHQLGAEIDKAKKNGDTALMHAAQNGHLEAIKLLHHLGAEIDKAGSWTALTNAAYNGHVEAIKLLHQLGANVDVKNNCGGTALIYAAQQGHVEAIQALLQLGAEIDKARDDGGTALSLAAYNGHVEAIKILVQSGADVNKTDNYGSSALMHAVNNRRVEAIETLLELGADINLQAENEDGSIWTTLRIAIKNNNHTVIKCYHTVIKCLLENGANYDGLDLQGKPDLSNEIEKIKKTKAVFAGDLSIPYDQINEKHLQYLCKQSGIPDHLLTSDENKTQSARYVDLVEKFKTSEADKKDDLNVLLGELLHHDDRYDFPAVAGFDMLSNPDFMTDDNAKKTIESYEKNRRLKPENFLNDVLNDEGYNHQKLAILIRNPEQADNFFLTTKNWILPQQQHDFLQKLKKAYFDISPSIKAIINHQHQKLVANKQILLWQQQALQEQKEKIIDLYRQLDINQSTGEGVQKRKADDYSKTDEPASPGKIIKGERSPDRSTSPTSIKPLLPEKDLSK